ncbi:MAG: hypothetical protein CMO19_03895 [Thaumarchaeota archaeon]|nr:hypothetical protein [Nitrososphaerota archaeon]|tara:strand:+ start:3750 stop:4229 length:480 start_codon:yes stop_codon:yes gene_type:complete
MTTSLTKIKLKISNTEVDIECDINNLPDVISQIPNIMKSISNISETDVSDENVHISDNSDEIQSSIPPDIIINKSDSLTDVLLKLFLSNWSNEPKKLNEIREVLQLYGLMYPKQTVAVTLLRMAKSGRLRRFKSNTGEYVYTASNSLLSSNEKLSKSAY